MVHRPFQAYVVTMVTNLSLLVSARDIILFTVSYFAHPVFTVSAFKTSVSKIAVTIVFLSRRWKEREGP